MKYKFSLLSLYILISQFSHADDPTAQTTAIQLPTITVQSENNIANNSYISPKSTSTKIEAPINEIAQSISIITRQAMDDRNTQNITEALRYSAGVLADVYGYDPRADWFVIRGYNAESDTYRDGLRHVNTGFLAPRINQYGLEQIDVIKGSASVFYGANNPGGIVNLRTKRPTDTPLNEVGMSFGSYNNRQLFSDFSDALNKEVKFRITSSIRNSDTVIDQGQDDSLYVAPTISWTPNENTELTILAQFQRDEQGTSFNATPAPYFTNVFKTMTGGMIELPAFSLNQNVGNPDYDAYDRDYAAFGYELKHRLNPTWQFQQNLRFESIDLNYAYAQLSGANFDPNTYQAFFEQIAYLEEQDAKNLRADQNLTGQWKFGNIDYTLVAGLDAYHLTSDQKQSTSLPSIYTLNTYSGTYPNISKPTTLNKNNEITHQGVALYALNRFKINDQWLFNLAGRYDWNDIENEGLALNTNTFNYDAIKQERTYKEFTGQASAMYLFENGLSPYISYSTGFKPSTWTDENGQLLKPETSNQIETGLKWLSKNQNMLVNIAVFQLQKQNEIRRNTVTQQVFQTGELETKGVELETQLKLPYGFDIAGSYTFNDAKVTKDDIAPVRQGTRPIFNPEHQANLWLNYRVPATALKGLTIGAGIRYVGEMDYLEDNLVDFDPVYNPLATHVPIHLDEKTLVDLALGYQFDRLNLNFKVNNVTDKKHMNYCMSQICQYGEERNYIATIKYRW